MAQRFVVLDTSTMKGVGPFNMYPLANRELEKDPDKRVIIVVTPGQEDFSIGEFSDWLQGMARLAAGLYEKSPEFTFSNIEEAVRACVRQEPDFQVAGYLWNTWRKL